MVLLRNGGRKRSVASVLAAGGSEMSLNCKGKRGGVLGPPAHLVTCRTVYLQAACTAAPSSVRDTAPRM